MISFFADKTITMGEGAVVLTQNEKIYNKLSLLRNQGRPNSGTFIHPSLGMNFRITDVQAAIGLVQAEKFPNILEKKLSNYKLYYENLKGIGDLEFLKVENNSTFVPFRFYIKTKFKDSLMKYLEENNIQTRSFFYPLHKQPPLKKYATQECIISKKLYETGICLPIHCELKEDDILFIIEKILEFFKKKV
jgi:dTDP-4-amino-4,6-dideoxygalactose transaminase